MINPHRRKPSVRHIVFDPHPWRDRSPRTSEGERSTTQRNAPVRLFRRLTISFHLSSVPAPDQDIPVGTGRPGTAAAEGNRSVLPSWNSVVDPAGRAVPDQWDSSPRVALGAGHKRHCPGSRRGVLPARRRRQHGVPLLPVPPVGHGRRRRPPVIGVFAENRRVY